LGLGCHCAGGVVGEAEVDEVDGVGWGGGDEVVFGGAGEIDYSFVSALVGWGACSACHYVGVDVDGVDGVGDGEG